MQVLLTLGIHNPQEHKRDQELVHLPKQSTPLLQHVPQSIWKRVHQVHAQQEG